VGKPAVFHVGELFNIVDHSLCFVGLAVERFAVEKDLAGGQKRVNSKQQMRCVEPSAIAESSL
jgi:hypothetical protein